MIRRRIALMGGFAIVAGAFLVLGPYVWADDDNGRIRFDGGWLISSPEIGIRGLETISSIDPAGRTASVQVNMLSGDPTAYGLCPMAYYISAGLGEAVRTGPSTVDATIMTYAMRPPTQAECDAENCRDQIECIWVMSGSSTFTRDTQDAVINFAIYPTWMAEVPPFFYPHPDTDDDLIPDEGVDPFLCLPIAFQAKRVPVMPPCMPPPLP
jgi:hypothetical protein